MKFEVTADVLFRYTYEIETVTKADAIDKITNEEIEPTAIEQATSPMITYIQEKKK